MRPGRMFHKLRLGEPAFSAKLNIADPRVVEIASMAGFDIGLREYFRAKLSEARRQATAAATPQRGRHATAYS